MAGINNFNSAFSGSDQIVTGLFFEFEPRTLIWPDLVIERPLIVDHNVANRINHILFSPFPTN